MKIITNDITRIESYIREIREYPSIHNMFQYLEENSSFYFLGGFIRSLYNEMPIRDIDIIYRPNNATFSLDSITPNISRNSLNGHKIIIAGIAFDLWNIFDNWAFKNGYYKPTFNNIQFGTFYNFDSLVYGFSEKALHCSKYNESVRNNILEIIDHNDGYISDNPTPELNIVKSCIYKYHYKLDFSNTVIQYINNWKDRCGDFRMLINEESRHFKECILSKNIYRKILNQSIEC